MTGEPDAAAGARGVAGELMRAEIAEQPDRWVDLLATQGEAITAAAAVLTERGGAIQVVARGSSGNAGVYGTYLAADELGALVIDARPSVTTVLGRSTVGPPVVPLVLSQSGASPDLLAVVAGARAAGQRVVAFTNVADSPLARGADVHVDLSAGHERSVAATKSYTAELLALFATVRVAAGQAWDDVVAAVSAAADVARGAVTAAEEWAPAVVAGWGRPDRAVLVGRGVSLASALEGALKLIETSGIAASGWSSAEVRHGPLGLVSSGVPFVTFGVGTLGDESTVDAALAAVDLGALVIAVGRGHEGAELVMDIDGRAGLDPALVPLVDVVAAQHLALAASLARGRDPDRPRGLSKVTLTR